MIVTAQTGGVGWIGAWVGVQPCAWAAATAISVQYAPGGGEGTDAAMEGGGVLGGGGGLTLDNVVTPLVFQAGSGP